MGKPLSIDLRSRLVAAVAGGLSRRSAAERFGVSAASAVRWVRPSTRQAPLRPSRKAATPAHIASRRSAASSWPPWRRRKISAWSSWPTCCGPSMGFVRGQHRLALPGPSRHDLQKKRRTPPSRSGPTSQPVAGPGSRPSLTLIRSAWSSSMRPGPRPRWPGCAAAPCKAIDAEPQFRMGIGKPRPSRERFA